MYINKKEQVKQPEISMCQAWEIYNQATKEEAVLAIWIAHIYSITYLHMPTEATILHLYTVRYNYFNLIFYDLWFL